MPETIIANELSLRDIVRARESLFGSLDAKRPRAWDQFGYPEDLSPDKLLQAYLRGGPAHGAVHHVLERCWQEWPRIKLKASDAESSWERALAAVFEKVGAWPKLQDWDRRNMIGRFSGLILRVADNQPLSAPLLRAKRLVDLVPVYEQQLRVKAWDSDSSSETFGQPLMWQYRVRSVLGGDQQARPDLWADVHPSRIVILAEGAVGDDFFDGMPMLQPGFNALVDLEKVSGGAAESYLKNSARTLVLKYEGTADVQKLGDNAPAEATGGTLADVVQAKMDRLNSNIDSGIVLQGGDASTLQTQMHDPRGAWEIAAMTFAAAVRIPFTILFGQQTGRLASDEDKAADNARCKARQRNLLAGAVTEVVRRLQGCGILESSDFEVEWPPLDSMGDDEKVKLLQGYTAAMQQAAAAGVTEPLFDANELRAVVDFEPRADDGMPAEGDADPAEDEPPQQRLRAAA